MFKQIAIVGMSVLVVGQALPSLAQAARTNSPDEETITGGRTVNLPTPPVAPFYYTLPMEIRIAKDPAVTTNTPITDKLGTQYAAWGEAIRACLKQKPDFLRLAKEKEVPFVVGDSQGTIKLNSNDKPVCAVQ